MMAQVAPQAAFAEPIQTGPCTVTSAADDGAGTLRGHLLSYACSSIDFDLAAMGSNTITLTSGEVVVGNDLTIDGPGGGMLTIVGGNNQRVLSVAAGSTVAINDLTLTGGNADYSNEGAGIRSEAALLTLDNVALVGNVHADFGGGAANAGSGDLIVRNSVVSTNTAANGAGLANTGTGNLVVIQSAITNNAVFAYTDPQQVTAMGGYYGMGGGIYNAENADTSVINSTISGNSAEFGGGIASAEYQGTSAVEVYLSTITNNTATETGGGIFAAYNDDPGLMRLQGNILFGNTTLDRPPDEVTAFVPYNPGPNISGEFISGGYNVVKTGTEGFDGPGDVQTDDAKLLPLQVRTPGATLVHPLLPGSPALNTIPGVDCIAALQGGGLGLQVADQRGLARPQGVGCDSGAYEAIAGSPLVTSLLPNAVPVGTGDTAIVIDGSGFAPDGFSVVTFNGVEYPATYIDATRLAITVPAAALATAGSFPVTVTNLTPGSGSSTLPFVVIPNVAPGFVLTLTTEGGAVTASPQAGPLSGKYLPGTVVTLTPQESASAELVGWTVDGQFQGWANPLTLTMDTDHTVKAIFRAPAIFGDVPSNAFGSVAIGELTTRGIINGYEDGTFGPTNFVKRAEIAAMVARAMGSDPASGPGVGPNTWATENRNNPFTDQGSVDDELWRAVAALAARDVARGYDDGSFDPAGFVNHAQAISLITRAMVAQGYWQEQPDNATYYTATFVHYAGALPQSQPTDRYDGPNGWDQPATRAWVAEALWDALTNYHPVDRVP
jgi:hypothetical protein